MKHLAILGCTGSIGTQTLEIVSKFPHLFVVEALAAQGSQPDILKQQIETFCPRAVYIAQEDVAAQFTMLYPHVEFLSGDFGLEELVLMDSVDFVVAASSGIKSLPAILKAIEAKKELALANKEVMVCAGEIVSSLAKKNSVKILPIDSEHNAIFQCLNGYLDLSKVSKLILTASGGPCLYVPEAALKKLTVRDVLKHPTWNMGPKVTVDSSTLVNKGLEMIEAHWLFDCPLEKLEAVVHPTSMVHGMVEWVDGHVSMIMNPPSMLYPIQYVLTYPEGRLESKRTNIDFSKTLSLDFFSLDEKKFRGFALAKQAIRLGGSAPCFFNAANEVLVRRFLREEISWLQITEKLTDLMEGYTPVACSSLEDVLEVDREASQLALVA